MDTTLTKVKSPANEKWGYKFSIDGLMSGEEAESFLGDISRRSLYRLVATGKIRKGKNNRKVVLCRRSVVEYAEGLEE